MQARPKRHPRVRRSRPTRRASFGPRVSGGDEPAESRDRQADPEEVAQRSGAAPPPRKAASLPAEALTMTWPGQGLRLLGGPGRRQRGAQPGGWTADRPPARFGAARGGERFRRRLEVRRSRPARLPCFGMESSDGDGRPGSSRPARPTGRWVRRASARLGDRTAEVRGPRERWSPAVTAAGFGPEVRLRGTAGAVGPQVTSDSQDGLRPGAKVATDRRVARLADWTPTTARPCFGTEERRLAEGESPEDAMTATGKARGLRPGSRTGRGGRGRRTGGQDPAGRQPALRRRRTARQEARVA